MPKPWFDIVDTIGDVYITTYKDIYEYMSVYTCLDWVEETNIFGDFGLGDMYVTCKVLVLVLGWVVYTTCNFCDEDKNLFM